MARAGEIVDLAHGYDGEVVYLLTRLSVPAPWQEHARSAWNFACQASQSRHAIREQLASFASSGQRVAIRGGTGKGAAFMHQYGVDAQRFPLVVDYDKDKVGSYVTGTSQRIAPRTALGDALIEHGGRLVNFHRDTHPY